MPAVNPKVIAAGWAAASWIRALRGTWDQPRLDVDTHAAGEAVAATDGRKAPRRAPATKPAKQK